MGVQFKTGEDPPIAYTALINVRKNYMIAFIDIEEGFNKIQHPFMILRKHFRK